MTVKRLLLTAAAVITLGAGAAAAQTIYIPQGNDPDGYYSRADQNGYYDRDGHYQRIRSPRYDDRGPPPPPPPPEAYGPPPGDYYQQGAYEQQCRRGNQADELVRAVADHAARLLLAPPPAAVVVGGDKALVRDVLADPRLAVLADLPRRELYDLPDPRRSVLEDALRRGRSVRVTVEDR